MLFKLLVYEMCTTTTSNASVDLLGFFKFTFKLTGLDVSTDRSSKFIWILTRLIAALVTLLMALRTMLFFSEQGTTLSFKWAEAILHGFLGLHSLVCCYSLIKCSSRGFISNYLRKLDKVRALREEQKNGLDDYKKVRIRSVFYALSWLVGLMAIGIYDVAQGKILFSGKTVSPILYSLIPVLDVLLWLISSHGLVFYTLVNFSMAREMEHFNRELEKGLKDLTSTPSFCHRQNELFKLISKTNEHLSSYSKLAPLFCFLAIFSNIYCLSFYHSLPLLYLIFLLILFFNILGVTFLSLFPACKVHDQITRTARILMENGELEATQDPRVFQMYRVMLDRCLKNDVRMYVVERFAIDSKNLGLSILIVLSGIQLILILKALGS